MGEVIHYIDIFDKWMKQYKYKNKPPFKLQKLFDWLETEEENRMKLAKKNKMKKK